MRLGCADSRHFGDTLVEGTLSETLEATFASSTRPPRGLRPTLGRSWAGSGAPRTSKANEFLRENDDFHFCVFSAPNALSEPQNASQDVPKAPQDAPQGVPGAPKSLSEMLWKHPRASLRRPRSTQRRPQRPQKPKKPPKTLPKLPKASPRRPRSTPKASPRRPRSTQDTPERAQSCSRGKCAPTRRRNNKRYLVRSHWGTRPQRKSRPLANNITNEACFKATVERSNTAHVLAATEQEVNR